MRTFLTLNVAGVLSALLLGAALLYLGWASGEGLLFLLVMVYFLVLSTLVTGTGKGRKERRGAYERGRGWRNVFANGIVPVVLAVIFLLDVSRGYAPISIIVAYIASIAAITSDKFASEVGILGEKPVMLLTMKPAKWGQSGGVSPTGIYASIIGAFLISSSMIALNMPLAYILIATVAGFLGNIVDSLLGYFEEHGIGNKYTSNIACAVTGAVLTLLVLSV